MDAETAWRRLAAMTAWESEPALTSLQMDDLVTLAQRADADGRAPSDADWTPTYNLNAAAALGWDWKAAKAAERYSVSAGGQSLSRAQLFEHCNAMAAMYRNRLMGSVPLRPAIGLDPDDDAVEVVSA